MVLKDGKWSPHSKVDGSAFGTALIRAEDVDLVPDFDGVKVMKIPVNNAAGVEPKEVWVSPRFEARAKAASASKIRAGVKQTQEQLAAARRESVKK